MRSGSFIAVVLCTLILASCSNKAGEEKLQKKILENARKYRDVNAASMAIQTLLAIDSAKYNTYKDTLLAIYATSGAEAQAVLLGKDLLQRNPKDTIVLTVLANANKGLGLDADAAKYFSSLYDITGKPDFLYEIAVLAYHDKQLDVCENILDTIEKLPQATLISAHIVFTYENGPRQNVPIDVAAANLHGVVEEDKGNAKKAEEYFQKALTMMPNFAKATVNLRRLQEKQK